VACPRVIAPPNGSCLAGLGVGGQRTARECLFEAVAVSAKWVLCSFARGRLSATNGTLLLLRLSLPFAHCSLLPLITAGPGTLYVPGLCEPVEIVRDQWGYPHIYAQSLDDAFFSQGFVHAQDR